MDEIISNDNRNCYNEELSANVNNTLFQELGIVILNYNSFDFTDKLLKNINSISQEIRIIVVDNCSTDDSFEKLRNSIDSYSTMKLTLIQTKKNNGYASGNNVGIRFLLNNQGKTKYLAIINPDIEIIDSENFHKTLEYLSENKNIGIISGVQSLDGELSFGWNIPNYMDLILNKIPILGQYIRYIQKRKMHFLLMNNNDKLIRFDVISGCFFISTLKIFDSIGLFDENTFLFFEENILAKKLKTKNLETYINKDFIYHHNHLHKKKDFKSIVREIDFYNQSEKYYLANYCGVRNFFLLNIVSFFHKNTSLRIKSFIQKK